MEILKLKGGIEYFSSPLQKSGKTADVRKENRSRIRVKWSGARILSSALSSLYRRGFRFSYPNCTNHATSSQRAKPKQTFSQELAARFIFFSLTACELHLISSRAESFFFPF